jgi:3-oxoacyl-[acyl-carrier protein] reductase
MLLKNKNAVIYGAGGSVGSAMARAFAKEGANVFLTGRHSENIKRVSEEIISDGGHAEFAVVDALDQKQVEEHLNKLVKSYGQVDISFNLISLDDVHGVPLVDLTIDEFVSPVSKSMTTQFITTTAAARIMKKQGNGVILVLTANAGKQPHENSGGFAIACAALEGLTRQLASELGKFGVRAVCLRSAGSPDAAGVEQAIKNHAKAMNIPVEEFTKRFEESTMLKHLPRLKEVASVATFMASDGASSITAAVINVTCGELAD